MSAAPSTATTLSSANPPISSNTVTTAPSTLAAMSNSITSAITQTSTIHSASGRATTALGATTSSSVPNTPSTSGGSPPTSTTQDVTQSNLMRWCFGLLALGVIILMGVCYFVSMRRRRRRNAGRTGVEGRQALERDLRTRFFGGVGGGGGSGGSRTAVSHGARDGAGRRWLGASAERRRYGRHSMRDGTGEGEDDEELPPYQAKDNSGATEPLGVAARHPECKPPDYDGVAGTNRAWGGI